MNLRKAVCLRENGKNHSGKAGATVPTNPATRPITLIQCERNCKAFSNASAAEHTGAVSQAQCKVLTIGKRSSELTQSVACLELIQRASYFWMCSEGVD